MRSSMRMHPPPEPHAALWSALRAFLSWLILRYGAGAPLAARVGVSRGFARRLRRHLRCLEALARRLLFARAAELPAPNAPLFTPRPSSSSKIWVGRGGFASDDPADWGISFRLIAPAPRARKAARRTPRRSLFKLISAAPLAERIEALVRVAADPERYARRLAALLRASPARARRLAREKLRRWADPALIRLWRAAPPFPNTS